MIEFMVKHAGTIAVLMIAISAIANFFVIYKRNKKNNVNVPKKDYVIGAVLGLMVAGAVIYFIVSAYK